MFASNYGFDEAVYKTQAEVVCDRGIAGLRSLASRFVDENGAESGPSPLRWLWILLSRWLGRHGATVLSLAMMPLAVWFAATALGVVATPGIALALTAPLLWQLSRRSLQDVTVALLALLTIASAAIGSPWLLGLAIFALLATKEAGALYGLAAGFAWHSSGAPLWQFAVTSALATVAYLAVTRALLGPDTWLVFRRVAAAHATEYGLENQSGHWHRLLVDLALVSPVAILFAAMSAAQSPVTSAVVVLCLAAHQVSPVNNVRTVLAADLLLRIVVGSFLFTTWGWLSLVVAVVIDALIFWKIRNVYDPVTRSLTRSLGMSG